MSFETAFTPLQSLGGGALIGAAAVLLMAGLGRIMGATGVLAGVLQRPGSADWSWRAALLLGMICGPAVFMALTGQMPQITVPVSLPMLIVGGFIVGVGVTFALGLHLGPWCLRHGPAEPALDRGDADLHGNHRDHGLCDPPRNRRMNPCA